VADERGNLVLVSACMAGAPCRYHGGASPDPVVVNLVTRGEAIPACPEMLAGLGTPRRPAEIVGGDGADVLEGRARVLDDTGRDVTEAFVRGAWIVLRRAQRLGLRKALLKNRSPSCGGTTRTTDRSQAPSTSARE
jgi:uncharacterized protein YbbK (DUF523 family)